MAQQGAQWIILRLLLNPCSNPHFYCNWNKQLMTWNLSAVESNPCAKDFKSQKRFFMFLSDLQQSGSTSTYSLGFSICLLTYNLISVGRQTWPFLLTYSISVGGRKCRSWKIFSHNLDNSTESVRMLNFRFKGWSKVWHLCAVPQVKMAAVSVKHEANAYAHMSMDTLSPDPQCNCGLRAPHLWIECTSSLPSWAAAVDRQWSHLGGPVHVMGCISVQPWGHSRLNRTGIHTAHGQMYLTAYSSFQEVIHLFQPNVFPFHHTISSGWGSPSSREMLQFSGCVILTDPSDRVAASAVVHQPWSTQDNWWAVGLVAPVLPVLHTTSGLSRASLSRTQVTPSSLPCFWTSIIVPEHCTGLQTDLPQGISWPWCCLPITPSRSNLQWLFSYVSLEPCQVLHPQTCLHP